MERRLQSADEICFNELCGLEARVPTKTDILVPWKFARKNKNPTLSYTETTEISYDGMLGWELQMISSVIPKIQPLALLEAFGILFTNFVLFFVAFFLGLSFGRGDLYACAIFYCLTGAISYIWTANPIITAIASISAFPFALAGFASAMTSNDTHGQNSDPLWSFVVPMDQDTGEALLLSVIASIVGWGAAHLFLRKQTSWATKGKPYFFFASISFIALYVLILILR